MIDWGCLSFFNVDCVSISEIIIAFFVLSETSLCVNNSQDRLAVIDRVCDTISVYLD